MRLIRYLNEKGDAIEIAAHFDLLRIRALLKKDCGIFLKELSKAKRGMYIFRGIKRALKGKLPIEKLTSRKDRQPSDVPQEIHNYVDSELNYLFGWRARSEGVFATSSFMTAASFGIPMYFFPIGKYRYIWGKDIGDFLGRLDIEGVIEFRSGWKISTTITREDREDRIDEILKRYTDKNLKSAIEGREEIIFGCKEYYLIDNRENALIDVLTEEIWS